MGLMLVHLLRLKHADLRHLSFLSLSLPYTPIGNPPFPLLLLGVGISHLSHATHTTPPSSTRSFRVCVVVPHTLLIARTQRP